MFRCAVPIVRDLGYVELGSVYPFLSPQPQGARFYPFDSPG